MAYNGPERRAVEPLTEDQLAWISDQTEHAAHSAVNRSLRKWAFGAGIAYVLILVALFLALKDGQNNLKDGLTGSCDRVNVLRAQSNGSDLVSFKILSLSGQREAALAKTDTENAKTHLDSAKGLWEQARNLNVTKLTDCDQAVKHPDKYVAPVAGPIGAPETGETWPGVQKLLDQSQDYLRSHGQ